MPTLSIFYGIKITVTDVTYIVDYKLQLTFNNGISAVVDLEGELYGEIFEPLKDLTLFRQVYLTSRTIEWPNGADFAPEFLLELVQASDKTGLATSIPTFA